MSTKDNIQREADSANQKLSEAASTVQSKAQEMSGQAQKAALGYAEEGKQVAASHLTDFAKAVRRASDELSERDQGVAAKLVTEAADGLEKVAASVSGTSMDEMLGSVQSFARRNPGAFIVGSVLAGVALGRFAKASSERSHDDYGSSSGSNYGSSSYGSQRPGGSGGTYPSSGGVSGGPAQRGQYGTTGASSGTSTGTSSGGTGGQSGTGSVGPASSTTTTKS